MHYIATIVWIFLFLCGIETSRIIGSAVIWHPLLETWNISLNCGCFSFLFRYWCILCVSHFDFALKTETWASTIWLDPYLLNLVTWEALWRCKEIKYERVDSVVCFLKPLIGYCYIFMYCLLAAIFQTIASRGLFLMNSVSSRISS